MRYRRLGRTGMMVSEIGFGTLPIGGSRWPGVTDADSIDAIRRAFDLGVNFFDTADVYGRGHSEELIAAALGGKRANVVIATKVGMDFYRGEPPRPNFDPDYIRTALERSLQRLRTDYLDLYQLHNPPQKLAAEGAVWETLTDLKREGKVRFYGISARTVYDALRYLKADAREPGRFGDTVQTVYNMLDQQAATKGVFVLARRRDIGVIACVPLASGMLTGKYGSGHRFPPEDFRSDWPPARLRETARRVEALRFLVGPQRTHVQTALAFVLSQEAVSTVIAGARNALQIVENVGATDMAPLPDEDLRAAQELYERGFDPH